MFADLMGIVLPAPIEGEKPPHYGRKALPGQYVKRYTREGHLTPGRVSKGCQKRYDHDHGTEGMMDYAGHINANR
jgi:hypothetical protein